MQTSEDAVYPAVLNPIPGGGYEVSFPDFPGCVTFGSTFEEAKAKAAEVLSLWIDQLQADHKNITRPTERPIIADVKVAAA